jgi:hypothetical protein
MFSASSLRTCRFYPETAPIDGRSTRGSVYNLRLGGVASGSSVAVAVASSADPKNPIMLDMVSLIFFEFFRNCRRTSFVVAELVLFFYSSYNGEED